MRGWLCVALMAVSLSSASQNLDIRLLRQFNLQRNAQLDPAFKLITDSSSPISIAAPTAVFGIGFLKHDTLTMRKGLVIGASLAVSSVITLGLKYGIDRDRPYVSYPDIEKLGKGGTPSFPSGHTSNAFATATSLSLAFPKWYVIAPAFSWAALVGHSRMHLGVHYPSDVLIGAVVGAGSAWLCYTVNKRLLKK